MISFFSCGVRSTGPIASRQMLSIIDSPAGQIFGRNAYLVMRQICNAPVGNVINATGRGIPGQLADFFGVFPKTNAILRRPIYYLTED